MTITQTSAESWVVAVVVDPEPLLTQGISVAGMLDAEFDYEQRPPSRASPWATGAQPTAMAPKAAKHCPTPRMVAC